MVTQLAHCPRCNRPVRLTLSPEPLHEGHATLPDGGELVCLEAGERCGEGSCPVAELPSVVMAARLARSGLGEEPAA